MNIAQKSYKSVLLLITIVFYVTACSSPSKYPASDSVKSKSHSKQKRIISIAKAQLGKPYRFGGTSPTKGFDCSGLINFSFKKAGLAVPRTTKQLYRASSPISRRHLKTGDLVFFKINRRKVSHVGLYLGNNRFIHAPSSGKYVNIANLNDKYWRQRFVRGGRI